MARKIKRLSDVSRARPLAQLIRNDPEAWERELAWWGGLGINTGLLLTLLESARVKRNQYEEQLKARGDLGVTLDLRAAKRALKCAEPLIRFLRTERTEEGEPLFGDLADQIEGSVQNYLRAARPGLPRHRPTDSWLRGCVILLAQLLRARKQSWKGTARAIHELLAWAGHGDVATAEKIRHYIREERRWDPKFGAAPLAGLGAWFAKSEPVIDLYPFDATASGRRRSRRPRSRRRPSAPVSKRRR